ncbi:hypothetical protein [Streptomyces sp. NPDC046925]|uniref:hypothetical protein n=1 Tax=Streptomyces sp. NPDC046925 TaxID=3155375 RepID=UPI00341132EF
MFRRKTKLDRVSIGKAGLFIPRRVRADVEATVPMAQRLVQDHFGQRPLGAVTVIVAKPSRIPGLAASAQGPAAGVPETVWQERDLSITARPNTIYVVTVVAPNGEVWMLLNSRLARTKPQELGATLVYGFVEVDQLSEKAAIQRRLALTRHEMGTKTLPNSKARRLYRDEEDMEYEAEQITKKIVGKVVQKHEKAEKEAGREVGQAEQSAA